MQINWAFSFHEFEHFYTKCIKMSSALPKKSSAFGGLCPLDPYRGIAAGFCWGLSFWDPLTNRQPLEFYRASICEGGLGSRNSVRLFVCLSHAWIVTNRNGALQIFWYHTKRQSLCYCVTNSVWWAMPPSLWNLCSKWPTPFENADFNRFPLITCQP